MENKNFNPALVQPITNSISETKYNEILFDITSEEKNYCVLSGLRVFRYTLATYNYNSFVSVYDTQYRCKSMTLIMMIYYILHSFC